VYLTRWIIFEAAVLGKYLGYNAQGGVYTELSVSIGGLNLESIVCSTYLPIYQNFEAALSMRNIDTNF
jgi:hypothetical protein